MLEHIKGTGHVIHLKMSGPLTGPDVARYRNLLEEYLRTNERISICVDLGGLSDIDAEALAIGVMADLELLRNIDQLERLALVSEKQWPRAIVAFVTKLFPTIEIKVFSQQDARRAFDWASEHAKPDEPHRAAISFIPTTSETVLAFEIDGIITAAEFPKAIDRFQRFFDSHENFRLLNRMTGFKGVEPAILTQSRLIAMKLAALPKLERYAIVGAPRWMSGMIAKMNDLLPRIDIRSFDPDSEADAWSWLEAEPLEAAA